MPRSLRASFSFRLGKGSGFLTFDQEAGAYQSCVCPVLVKVMPGTGAAGFGGGGRDLLTPTLLSDEETGRIPCSGRLLGTTLLTGESSREIPRSRCSLG